MIIQNYLHLTIKAWKLNLIAVLNKSWPCLSATVFAVGVQSSLICLWGQGQRPRRGGHEIIHTHSMFYSGGPSRGTLASVGEWGEMLYPTVWHLSIPSCPTGICLAAQKLSYSRTASCSQLQYFQHRRSWMHLQTLSLNLLFVTCCPTISSSVE